MPWETVIGLEIHTQLATQSKIFSGSSNPELTYEVCKYLGIPMFSTAGCSDSNEFDEQATFEAGVSILMAALSGANLIHDVGYLGQGLIANPAMLVGRLP